MRLSAWLAREGIKQGEFAKRVGVSGATISDLCRHKIWLSRPLAARIELETGGEVTAADFVHRTPVKSNDATDPRPQEAAA